MKMFYPTKLLTLLAILFLSINVTAQGPGSLFVDAGPDVLADCATGGCTDITATFLETFDTSGLTYTVGSIPYNPPFPFNGLANSLNPNIDDAWSSVDTLPFDFCFFGNLETEFQVGSNGVIRFDVDPGDTSNGWSFTENLPNNTNPTLGEANVFTPGHDIDPSASSTEEIAYEVLGTYPNRVLVVSYFEVPMYSGSCNSLLATHMAVFYEFSNVIEIYIQDKPSCPSWNSGNAALGIQNNAGDTAYVPPGRNTSDSPWTATNEAWSFSPDGPPTYVFGWYDSMGNFISNSPTINVCVSGTETFEARVTWTNTCNGDVVTLSDFVNVTSNAPFTIDLGPDVATCDQSDITLDADPGIPGLSYEWFLNGVSQGPSTINDNTFTVTAPNSALVTVEVFDPADPSCITGDSVQIDFLVQPAAFPPVDLFQCDDGINMGIFDLTVNDANVLGGQNPALFNITYHNSLLEANAGANPIAVPTAYMIATPPVETVWVRIEDLTGTCFEVEEFLIQFQSATAGPMTDIVVCDDDANGIVTLDLVLLKNSEALGTQSPSLFTVTYHPSQADADANTNAHPNPYDVTAPSETIFVRVENNATPTCYATDSFVVDIFEVPPVNIPTPLEACDEIPNDGFAEFDLTSKDAEITGGNPNAAVTYHLSFPSAQAGTFPIASPYTNATAGFQTVYARVENINNPDCFDIVPLDLQVNDSPAITDPITDYFICDNDQDGVEIFDLTTKDAEILNILVNVTLTYHLSEPEATAGLNPIATPGAYPSGGEVIWVRGENSAGCFTVGSFGLILGDVPIYVEVPVFEQCDNDGDGVEAFDLNSQNATIVDGNLALTVSYHPTQVDADANTNPLMVPYTSGGETIFVRVEDNITGCYGTFTMDLVVVMAPEIFPPDPLTFCDDDNDGFGEFNLTDADEDVVNGNPAGNLVVSYHETLADAQNGVNPLASPYANVDPFLQTVYVRLTDIATGCYSTTTLLLIVQDSPLINDPQPLVVCDDDNDGFAVFDLTQAEPEILGSLNPMDYTISYYEDAGLTVAIVNTTAYVNLSNPQTLFVVVEDISNGCQGQTTLELQVNLPPQINAPTPLELCDVNNPGDEMEAFDLESKTFEITGGNPGIIVTYHETQADADAGTNPLSSPYVNQVPQPQTIFIRAVGAGTGCVTSSGFTLDLVVNPLPFAATPTPLEVCDTDNDGFALFDLQSKDDEITLGDPLVFVTYHETLSDAQAGIFALASPYQNIIAVNQTVYARATYSLINPPPFNTGCFRVVELELVAVPTPEVPLTLDPLVICDPEGNGTEVFDLTLQDAAVLGTQDPSAHTITYHESLLDAQSGTPFIGTPTAYQNTSNPQTIWVRLTNNASACFAITSFELQAPAGPAVTQPTPLSVCDDVGEVNDGFTIFDLTVKNDEITGGVLGVGVQYFETLDDAQNNVNAIDPATAYQNISNPQTVYVRVTDGNSGCVDTTVSLTLRVNANPEPTVPDALELCDINDPGDGTEVFDLTQSALQITGGSPWDLSYHESLQDALEDVNEIVDPTMYSNTSTPQILYVRVENNTIPEGCFEVVELELIVNPLPDASAVVSPLILCEVPSDGFGLFDLTSKIPEILNGQDPSLYQVSFYEDALDAAQQLNPILNTTSYPNTSNPQTIWVGILNADTGCYIAEQSFEIEEREGAVAGEADPYVICDNLDANDGIGEFALDGSTDESQALIDQILGGQDPTLYLLSFHPTLEDAQANTNPLSSPFVNSINPQVIYARVSNSGTDCFDITQVILKVEELPEVTLDEFYRLCVDANGNPIPEEEGALSPPVIDTGLDPSIYSFEWFIDGVIQLGQTDPSIVALRGGTYSVIVTEIDSECTTEASTTVTESSPPLVFDAQVVSQAFASDHSIQATAEGLGEYIFQLDDGPFQAEGLFTGVDPGRHFVTIKDANGCGSVVVEVSIIDYPRFVTPNQDGYHDTWNIIGIAGGDPTAKIYIFDRFGKLLKQLSPLGEGWDGTYNGNPMPSSDYWFVVEYTEEDVRKEFRGHFTLKR